ncbi:TIGR03943 family protein [Streptomyces sp. NPDC048442]|uniref:TIGR03943 family putative permease subunit n=1 Tax=Streptomyces sp. NPDC048442 TaxID=3154823 RepID=UPI003415104E
MRRTLQNVLLLILGAGVLRISLFSDICLRYVKEGLQPYVVVAGLVLTALGVLGVLRDAVPALTKRHTGPDGPGPEPDHGHGHDHSQGPRVAWLLLPPALALLLFAPPALGSYTAARDRPQLVVEYDRFDPLPATGPVPLSMTEYVARLQQEESGSLKGRTVVLQGLVLPGRNGTWRLARLLVSCCAADSQTLSVAVHGAKAPPADSWVRVTGTWPPGGTLGTTSAELAVNVTSVTPLPEPANPYLDKAPGR